MNLLKRKTYVQKKQISNFESFSNFSPINFRITIFNYFIFFFIFFNEQLFLNIGNKLTNISQYINTCKYKYIRISYLTYQFEYTFYFHKISTVNTKVSKFSTYNTKYIFIVLYIYICLFILKNMFYIRLTKLMSNNR